MKKTAQNMGHHIQNLDKMDHNESREEASKRREEKKTKSKKARLASHKAGEPGEAAAVDNDSEDGGADNDVGPRVDKFGNALLPEPDAIRSKMLAVIASLDRSLSSIRGGETTPESFHIRGDGPDKQRWAGGHRGPAAGHDQLLRPGSRERRAGRRARHAGDEPCSVRRGGRVRRRRRADAEGERGDAEGDREGAREAGRERVQDQARRDGRREEGEGREDGGDIQGRCLLRGEGYRVRHGRNPIGQSTKHRYSTINCMVCTMCSSIISDI